MFLKIPTIKVWLKLLTFHKSDLIWNPKDGLEPTVSKLCPEMPITMKEMFKPGLMFKNLKKDPLKLSVSLMNKKWLIGCKLLEISKTVMLKLLIISPLTLKMKFKTLKLKNNKKLTKLNLIAKKKLFINKMNTKLNIKKMKILKKNLDKFPLNWEKKVPLKPNKDFNTLKKPKELKIKLVN